jgi:hypothetical protein
MSETTYTPLHIVPEGREMLACNCLVPDGWVQVPLPEEEHDFSQPTTFLPLLVCMAPYGAVLFTIAARPSFDDGTVQDWAEYLASNDNIEIEQVQQARIGRSPCVLFNATQASHAGIMRIRSVFLEDGGRLYNIGTMAPEQIWPSVEPVFHKLLGAFQLDEIKGLTAQPLRLMTSDPVVDLSEDYVAPTAAKATEVEEPSAVDNSLVNEALAGIDTTDPREGANEASSNERATQPADVALADDPSSLDQENEMTARMRDNGVGLVPRIIMTSHSAKFVTVGAGAIEAMFRVPFGWHVIDDGKRTLVFDAGGKMQINLDLRPATPDQHISVLQGIGDELAAENPEALFLKMEFLGMPCLGVRNLVVNGETLEQAYFIRESNRPDMALVVRVTADPENFTFAANTAEVILTSLQGPPPLEEEFQGQPEWWVAAVRLERENKLEEAEQIILKALDHIGVYSSLAHLYEERMARLHRVGDAEGAKQAKERAIQWLYSYAGSATSGGEGAALSYERDQRIAALGGEESKPTP